MTSEDDNVTVKLSRDEVYQQIIDIAHKNGLPVAETLDRSAWIDLIDGLDLGWLISLLPDTDPLARGFDASVAHMRSLTASVDKVIARHKQSFDKLGK